MAQVFILVEGSAVDAAKVETALRPAGVLTPVGATRGLGNAAAKVLAWVLEFTGESSKEADQLIQEAMSGVGGCTIRVQLGDSVVSVENASRLQVLEILDRAAALAHRADEL